MSEAKKKYQGLVWSFCSLILSTMIQSLTRSYETVFSSYLTHYHLLQLLGIGSREVWHFYHFIEGFNMF